MKYKICGVFTFLSFWFCGLLAQTPDYYDSIDFDQQGFNLRVQLSNLITDTHNNLIPYTSGSTDTWDVIRISDLAFENAEDVLLIYGYNDDDDDFINDRSRDAYDTCHTSWCAGLWNREHVFARSLSDPSLTTYEPGPGTDIHNLRAADSQKNTQRSNRLFADGSGNSVIVEGGFFFPGDEWKGDVARIIMYMYLRYPGQCEAVNSGSGPITYATDNDMPDLFLEWNHQDPVSDFELRRNETIYNFQGNRNPFIDNPYLAYLIWNGPEAEDLWGMLSTPTETLSSVVLYPSPATDYIQLKGLDTTPLRTIVYNQLGQPLLEFTNQSHMDISALKSGIYILKLEELKRQILIKFIVK